MTQFYLFYFKWHVFFTLYNQHSYAYSFIRDPPRLRFWLKALAPITPLFGGVKLVENNMKYTMFTTFIAVSRGLVNSRFLSHVYFSFFLFLSLCGQTIGLKQIQRGKMYIGGYGNVHIFGEFGYYQ